MTPVQEKIPSLYDLARDPILIDCYYRSPSFRSDRIGASGAAGVNRDYESGRTKDWFVELQRYGADLIQGGITLRENDLLERGARVLDWAFAKQGPDGNFPGTKDAFHSTELFIEGAARACLVLKLADMRMDLVERFTPKVRAGAIWLMRPEIVGPGRVTNAPYLHRHWILASALGIAGRLTGEASLSDAAKDWAENALPLQRPDGVNPEKGDFDVNYQSAGIHRALRYSTVCPAPLRPRVIQMIRRGLALLLDRTDERGVVDPTGSSRTGKEVLRSGVVKEMNYMEYLQVLCFASQVLGESRARAAAEAIRANRRFVGPEQLL